MVIGELNDDD
uniref:Uncharacterized protein n=1 Tax=Medicago truncatula TaxID=3880 RepID=I3SHW9_MEDTR|nr:unknown [Medicago truncatula]